MTALTHYLATALETNGITLPKDACAKLITYLDLVVQWNKIFNLTSITDPKEMVMLHLLDSLIVESFLLGDEVIDVGTGAGFPGIPLALARPEKNFVLLDSNSKKTRFLTHVVHTLGLKNVTVVHARCENFREKCFTSVITRAFATLATMLHATEHLLQTDGQFLAMKGLSPTTELAAVPNHFKVVAVTPLIIKGCDVTRHIVCITRLKN
jgi:16S rRNA (guanine527-N7)-methyltransferase